MHPPDTPAKQRLRTVRRRVTTGVLATFVAAWVAVAALGKGGGTSSTPTTTPSSSSSTPSDSGASDSPSAPSSQPGPVTTSQS